MLIKAYSKGKHLYKFEYHSNFYTNLNITQIFINLPNLSYAYKLKGESYGYVNAKFCHHKKRGRLLKIIYDMFNFYDNK